MSNGVFMIGPDGSRMLDADLAWHEYVSENSDWLRDPWEEISKIRNKYLRHEGQTLIIEEISAEDAEKIQEWKDSIDSFRRFRDRWTVEFLLDNCGYETAKVCAVTRNDEVNDLLWWFEQLRPCEHNADCNIFCKNFNNCIKEGFFEWN